MHVGNFNRRNHALLESDKIFIDLISTVEVLLAAIFVYPLTLSFHCLASLPHSHVTL